MAAPLHRLMAVDASCFRGAIYDQQTCRARTTLLARLISRLTSRKGSLRQLSNPHSVHLTCGVRWTDHHTCRRADAAFAVLQQIY